MKLCPQCESSLAEDTMKCPHCGTWMVPKRGSSRRSGRSRIRKWVPILLLAAAVAGWFRWGPEIPDLSTDQAGIPSPPAPGLEIIRGDLERLFDRQETHFRDRGEFAGLPSILDFTPTDGVRISIVSTGEAWSATAVPETGPDDRGCAVFVGSIPAPREPIRPMEPGRIECGSGSQSP